MKVLLIKDVKSQDKTGDGTVFRCVHCLYLLKLPASIQTAVRMHSESKKRGTKRKEVQIFEVKPILAKKLGDIDNAKNYQEMTTKVLDQIWNMKIEQEVRKQKKK